MYQGKYPLATALGRPLIATKLVEVAEKEGAYAVAHGCTGKGNDQVRMDVTVRSLNPSIKVIAPVREWNMSRDKEIEYAKKHGINIKPKKSIFSTDQNLWGRSIESGPLEDPETEPPAERLRVGLAASMPRRHAAGYLEIGFDRGHPRLAQRAQARRRRAHPPGERVRRASTAYGIVDHIEDRLVGIKSREVYECPAALAIIEAHRDLEQLVLTRNELAFKAPWRGSGPGSSTLGFGWSPCASPSTASSRPPSGGRSGKVKLKFHKGSMRVVGRSSPNSLYRLKLSTYSKESTFDQNSAVGFIELWGLQSRTAANAIAPSRREPTGVTTRGQHTERKQSQALK